MGFNEVVLILVAISLAADALDGFLARKLGVSSELGLQLDSLADMVTFGVLPGMILFSFLMRYNPAEISMGWAATAMLVPVFAGLRLARFNIDTRDSNYFYGLPTPAGGVLVFGLLWLVIYPSSSITNIFLSPAFLYSLVVFLCFLYHAPLKMLSLKGDRRSKGLIGFILLVALITFFTVPELTLIIPLLLYILLGFVRSIFKIY